MSDFKTKMHQIRFRLGLCPRPAGGAYSAPPDPLAGFRGPTSKGRGGEEGREWEVKEGKRRGRGEGKEGKGRGGRGLSLPKVNFLVTSLQLTNHCLHPLLPPDKTRHLATCLGPGDMHFNCLHARIICIRNHLSLVVCLSF